MTNVKNAVEYTRATKQYSFEAIRIILRAYGKPTNSVPISVLIKRLANPFRKLMLEFVADFFVNNTSIPKN